MAQVKVVRLVDDLDGVPADTTVRVALDGTAYEIDLSEKNDKELRAFLDRYIAAARTIGKVTLTSTTPRSRSSAGRGDQETIRAWARAQGHWIGTRGRIPKAIADLYAGAHPGSVPASGSTT